jgi:hypothetical protein
MNFQGREGKLACRITDVITDVTTLPHKGMRGVVAGDPGTK